MSMEAIKDMIPKVTQLARQSKPSGQSKELSLVSPSLGWEVFTEGLEKLILTFPNLLGANEDEKYKQAKFNLWFEILKDLSVEEFEMALERFCKEKTELYPNSNIGAILRQYGTSERVKGEGEAWHYLQQALKWWLGQDYRIREKYKWPTLKDKLVQKAAEAIGWKELFYGTNQEVTRAHFFKVYNSMK